MAAATTPLVLGADHLFGPTAFDVLAWASLALVVVRIGRTGDSRWWLAGGLILGLGLANKHSVGFFAVARFIGALLSGGRRMVLNRWFAAGAAIAVAFTIPDIWWQAQHEWATIAMTRALAQENGGAASIASIASWVIGQLLMTALAMIVVWV
ncbi:MAG TPA: glycosyltransferase family 39 protein, partial [Streptosporangiaceae bacterium]|nr:glycosyltransferase family 39 protein [Streptosporangiaceae bacterium]